MAKDTPKLLLDVLQEYAPNGAAQGMCAEIYNDMQEMVYLEHDTKREAELALVGALAGMIFDGVNYGNWPWTKV